MVFANIRAVGVERTTLATDLAQKTNPPVAESCVAFSQRQLDAGSTTVEINRTAATIPPSERAPDGAANAPPPLAALRVRAIERAAAVETGERCLLPRRRVRVSFLCESPGARTAGMFCWCVKYRNPRH
jgi:hypothetical protein